MKMKEGCKFDTRNTQIKAFNGWRNIYREIKKEKEE